MSKEFIPPEVEFSNDPMMRELHEIRLKMYEETKKMSNKEWIKYIKKKAGELREQYEKKILS